MPGLLDRSRCIAPLGFDRWRVPPTAIAVQLSIGQVYALGVFDVPLSRLIGVTASAPDDWNAAAIARIFTIAIVSLGLAAFLFGRWIEEAGPRKAMFVSAACFGGGFLVAALGVQLHLISLVYLGYGVIGGIGLGIGYLSPVSTLLKWFPERPGMATGLALAGFGGGAMIASPLSEAFLERFTTANSNGVVMTLVTLGVAYFAFMSIAAFAVRIPATGWKPHSFTAVPLVEPGSGPRAPRLGSPVGRSVGERREAAPDVHVAVAMRTRAFWLLWFAFCLCITVGVGVFALASPMIQETFPLLVTPQAAAAFVAVLGLAGMLGRLAAAWISDVAGAQRVFIACFALGAALCALLAGTDGAGTVVLFVTACGVIVSLLDGVFATIPVFLRDTFGLMHLDAIHGRLLSAWPVAAIAGPALVSKLIVLEVARGSTHSQAHGSALFAMAGLLVLALVATWRVRPVDPRHHFKRGVAHA